MKVIRFLIEGVYWLNLFILPLVLLAAPGFIIHHNYDSVASLLLLIALGTIGVVAGVYYAERVRRTVGCSYYVNRVFWSRDITNAAAVL